QGLRGRKTGGSQQLDLFMDRRAGINIGVEGAAIRTGHDIDTRGIHLRYERSTGCLEFFCELSCLIGLSVGSSDPPCIGGLYLRIDIVEQAILAVVGVFDAGERLRDEQGGSYRKMFRRQITDRKSVV